VSLLDLFDTVEDVVFCVAFLFSRQQPQLESSDTHTRTATHTHSDTHQTTHTHTHTRTHTTSQSSTLSKYVVNNLLLYPCPVPEWVLLYYCYSVIPSFVLCFSKLSRQIYVRFYAAWIWSLVWSKQLCACELYAGSIAQLNYRL
jgi:ABC-type nickel/cobalt efflux system permease component RcnA